ncbi:hypothetical protein P3L10_025850 [Capsicum annuum]
MASKGLGKGRHKKGTDNLPAGQYTPLPPTVTTTLQQATTNILPPSRTNISLPNTFFMPPPPHQFQPSSPHTSLHSRSSSIPSTSSTPSIYGLRIEGASTSKSPSIDSATTSNATKATSQFPKFKEVVEYDGNDKLIIAPDGGNRFIPASSGGHMIIEIIKPFYTQPWGSWNEIKLNVRVLMWNQFVTKCAWNSCHENKIQRIFKFKVALRIKEHLYLARKSLKKPGWLNADVWVKFLEKWDTPEFVARRERAKENRASQTGGSLHPGGSMSFATHRRRLVILA